MGSRGERSRHAAAAAKKVLPPRYRQYDTPFDVEPWHLKPPVAGEGEINTVAASGVTACVRDKIPCPFAVFHAIACG